MSRLVRSSDAKMRSILWALAAGNVLAWVVAVAVFHAHPVMLGTALLAYLLGLRHAVDADHIAAIDNVTRKLLQDGVKPTAVGLHFSLGHSTVVVVACAVLASASLALRAGLERWHAAGRVVGTAISATFLFVIALANIVMLVSVYRAHRHLPRAEHAAAAQIGWLSRLLRPLLALVTKPWHMYGLGLLFGLGFDTASEVTLLAIAAGQGSSELPLGRVMIFPALFTAAMSLVDTLNGIVMMRAYGWALNEPAARIRYNVTITLVSVIVAVIVGSIQLATLFGQQRGNVLTQIAALQAHFVALGAGIIALLVGCWGVAVLLRRRLM